jgi:hypothetical protein
MKLITSVILLALLSSCKEKKPQSETEKFLAHGDSLIAKYNADQKVKTATQEAIASVYTDTSQILTSPVKVVSYRVVKNEYSSYKNVSLTWKNISNKSISGIKFRWQGVDAFGEPADLGDSFAPGFEGGFTTGH